MSQSAGRSLFFYFSGEIFLSFGIGMSIYALPLYYSAIGLPDNTVGFLLAVNSAVSGLAALIFGSVADRVGASRVFKLATATLPIGYLITGLSHQMSVLLFASGVTGLGVALLLSTENVVLNSLMQGREKTHVLSRFVALYMFIMGAGVVFAGFASSWWGYQASLVLGAAIACVAPILRLFIQAPDVKSAHYFRLPSRKVLKMSLFAMALGIGTGIFNPFLSLVLVNHFHLHDRATALVYAASLFMVSLGSYGVSILIKRFNRDLTLLFSFVLGVALSLLMAFSPAVWPFAAFYLGRTAAMSIPGPIMDAIFLELSLQTEYAQMFGVRVFGNSVGNSIGSYAGGSLLNRGQLATLLVISGLVYAACYVYQVLLLRSLRRTT